MWTYSDWVTLSGAARLTRLRLHVQEVADALHSRSTAVSADGKSMTREQLVQYYESVARREREMGAAAGGSAGGVSHIRFRRPG